MRILFDNKIFINQINGGPSVYFINLIKKLQEINCEAKISSKLHLSNALSKSGIHNAGKKIPFNSNLIKYNSLRKFLHKINNKSCNHEIKIFKPNIFHTTYYEKYNYFNESKLEKIVTIFDLINEKFSKTFYKEKKISHKKEILNFADKIICISNSTKKDLLNFYNIDEKKISVIYLGYPKKKTNLKKIFDFPYILYVGTRWKYKNFENLLKAISLSNSLKNNFKLVAFGGGKFNSYEENLIKKYNLKNIFQIDGDDAKLHSCYKHASLFVYPTKYEGFGLPILESFLYGCPVACSYNSSLPEVAGEGAIYFNPDDPNDICNKIEKILISSEMREEFKNKSILQLKKFSWSKCAKETFEFYKS